MTAGSLFVGGFVYTNTTIFWNLYIWRIDKHKMRQIISTLGDKLVRKVAHLNNMGIYLFHQFIFYLKILLNIFYCNFALSIYLHCIHRYEVWTYMAIID
jgi:hypothetical protein